MGWWSSLGAFLEGIFPPLPSRFHMWESIHSVSEIQLQPHL